MRKLSSQARTFETALAEIEAGQKQSHWSWSGAAEHMQSADVVWSHSGMNRDTFKIIPFLDCDRQSKDSSIFPTPHPCRFVIPTPPYVVGGVEKGSEQNRFYALRSEAEGLAFLRSQGFDCRLLTFSKLTQFTKPPLHRYSVLVALAMGI